MIEKINACKPTYQLMGFLDGAEIPPGTQINGYPFLGGDDWIIAHKHEIVCTCTIGTPKYRRAIQERLESEGVRFETLVCLGVDFHSSSQVGAGSLIFPAVSPSVNCVIGKGVFINYGVTIGHDAVIADYSCVMTGSGISGGCIIGKEVAIGGHAFITPKRHVGEKSVIAAGSVVFSNVKAGTTVLGNPAKRMRELEG